MSPKDRESFLFTGIVETVGTVRSLEPRGATRRLTIALRLSQAADEVRVGESIAVNGVCLTVAALAGDVASFDVVPATLTRSNLGALRAGDEVNLERALAVGERLGGHFVQGHVDGVGRVEKIVSQPDARQLHINVPHELTRLMIPQGSIAVDGISLTIAGLHATGFYVAIVPHTWEVTNISRRKAGDAVNIEVDMLGKYVRRLLEEDKQ